MTPAKNAADKAPANNKYCLEQRISTGILRIAEGTASIHSPNQGHAEMLSACKRDEHRTMPFRQQYY
jgi:hypothetical protein